MKYQITITKTPEITEEVESMLMGRKNYPIQPIRIFHADNINPDQAIELLQYLYDLTKGIWK